jgi:hypothetical protein
LAAVVERGVDPAAHQVRRVRMPLQGKLLKVERPELQAPPARKRVVGSPAAEEDEAHALR